MAQAYIDAAASNNPKLAAGAVVFRGEEANLEYTVFHGEMDNHEAEWATLEYAVEKALEHSIDSLIIHTDSKIITDTFDKGHARNPVFSRYFERISRKSGRFQLFLVSWTPRKQNRHADELAKETLYRNKKRQI